MLLFTLVRKLTFQLETEHGCNQTSVLMSLIMLQSYKKKLLSQEKLAQKSSYSKIQSAKHSRGAFWLKLSRTVSHELLYLNSFLVSSPLIFPPPFILSSGPPLSLLSPTSRAPLTMVVADSDFASKMKNRQMGSSSGMNMTKSTSISGDMCNLEKTDGSQSDTAVGTVGTDDKNRRSSIGAKMQAMVGMSRKSQSTSHLSQTGTVASPNHAIRTSVSASLLCSSRVCFSNFLPIFPKFNPEGFWIPSRLPRTLFFPPSFR